MPRTTAEIVAEKMAARMRGAAAHQAIADSVDALEKEHEDPDMERIEALADPDLPAKASPVAEARAAGRPMPSPEPVAAVQDSTNPSGEALPPLTADVPGRLPAQEVRDARQALLPVTQDPVRKAAGRFWEMLAAGQPHLASAWKVVDGTIKGTQIAYDIGTRAIAPMVTYGKDGQPTNVANGLVNLQSGNHLMNSIMQRVDAEKMADHIKMVNGFADERTLASVFVERAQKMWSGELKLDARANVALLIGQQEQDWLDNHVLTAYQFPATINPLVPLFNMNKRDYIENPATWWQLALTPAGPWTMLQHGARVRDMEAGRTRTHSQVTFGDLSSELAYTALEPLGWLIWGVPKIPVGVAQPMKRFFTHGWGRPLHHAQQKTGQAVEKLSKMALRPMVEPIDFWGEGHRLVELSLKVSRHMAEDLAGTGRGLNSWLNKTMKGVPGRATQMVKRSGKTTGFNKMEDLGKVGGKAHPWGRGEAELDQVRRGNAAFVIDPTKKAIEAARKTHQVVDVAFDQGRVRQFIVPKNAVALVGKLQAIMKMPRGPERSFRLRLLRGDDVADIHGWTAATAQATKFTMPEIKAAWKAIRADGTLKGRKVNIPEGAAPVRTPAVHMSELDIDLSRGSLSSKKIVMAMAGHIPGKTLTDVERQAAAPLRQFLVDNLIRPANKVITKRVKKNGKWVEVPFFDEAELADPANLAIFKNLRGFLAADDLKHVPSDVMETVGPRNIAEIWFPKKIKGAPKVTDPALWDAHQYLSSMTYLIKRKMHLEPMFNEMLSKESLKGLQRHEERYLRSWIAMQSGKGPQHHTMDDFAGWFLNRANQLETRAPVFRRLRRALEESHIGRARRFRWQGKDETIVGMSPAMELANRVNTWVLRGILGGDPKSAFQNPFLIVNIVAKHGIKGLMKGIVKELSPEFRAARHKANLLGGWSAIFSDDVFKLATTGEKVNPLNPYGNGLDNWLFLMFQSTEMLPKGIAFNIGMEEFITTAIKQGRGELHGAKNIGQFFKMATKELQSEAAQHGYNNSMYLTHMYGGMNKAPMLQNPAARSAMTLLSFTPKQIGFLIRQTRKDPTGLLRYFAMSAKLVDLSERELGLDVNRYVGWGFKPMTRNLNGIPLVESPPIKAAISALGYVSQSGGEGDLALRDEYAADFKNQIGYIAGGRILPARAIHRASKMVRELQSGEKRTAHDNLDHAIRADQSLKQWLFGQDVEFKRARDVTKQTRDVEKRRRYIMQRRVDKLLKVWLSERADGDDLGQAWVELYAKPFDLPHGKSFIANDLPDEQFKAFEASLDKYVVGWEKRHGISGDDRRLESMSEISTYLFYDDLSNARSIRYNPKVKK